MLLLNYRPVLRQPTGIGVYANGVLPALQGLEHTLIPGGGEGGAKERLQRLAWSQRRLPLPAAETANGTAHANDAAAPLTPAALWLQLELGGGETLPATVRVAINQAFASPHQPLVAGDELAFLPPISGG
jgi:molybdopterin synthase sulfur carrier subunit